MGSRADRRAGTQLSLFMRSPGPSFEGGARLFGRVEFPRIDNPNTNTFTTSRQPYFYTQEANEARFTAAIATELPEGRWIFTVSTADGKNWSKEMMLKTGQMAQTQFSLD